MNNTKLIIANKHSINKVYFHQHGEFASNLDPIIPLGTAVEYYNGDINKDYLIDSQGKIISSKHQTCALQYVNIIWNGIEGYVCTCDVRLAA